MFLFSGAVAGIAGGLFASLQSYITPDAFTFDLSVLFFIAILIGGRGSILGPLLGTIILTALPEFAAPLVAWSTFLYAVLLLVIVLAVPGRHRRPARFQEPPPARAASRDRPAPRAAGAGDGRRARSRACSTLKDLSLSFGGVRAIDGVDLEIRTGRGARADRPQRQRQDHDAERDLRILRAAAQDQCGWTARRCGRCAPHTRAAPAHCPHLPDPAAGRRRFRPGKRDDRRHDARSRQLRRSRCWRFRAIGATRRICARRRRRRWRRLGWSSLLPCARTACSTASCASSRSRAR